MDTMRGEVEAIAKQHQSIAAQMKTELDEPLAAFAGGMKERRKIVQSGIEKILKTKVQQTHQVNKVCIDSYWVLGVGWYHMYQKLINRKNKTDTRQVRARMPKDQGLSCPRPYGHGTGGETQQGKAGKDTN